MQYVLLFSLIGIFLLSYCFTGKDILAPMTAQILTFLFVSSMCIYILTFISYELHKDTIILIISCLSISALVGSIVHKLFLRVHIKRAVYKGNEISHISSLVHACVIIYIVTMLIWRVLVIIRLGGGMSNVAMNMFYQLSVSGKRKGESILPFGLRQADHICDALFIVYGFNLFRFYRELSRKQITMNMIVIFLCLLTRLLGSQRMAAVQNIVVLAMIYHLLRIQRVGKYRKYNVKMILRLILLGCLVLFLFIQLSSFVGREVSGKVSIMRHLSVYAGAEIVNLDIYLQNPGPRSEVFGMYTFPGIISILKNLGLVKVGAYSNILEFHYISGQSTGNLYSCFRAYYKDFGMTGVYVLHLIMSLCYSIIYEYVKKKLSNKGILLFSYMYCGVILSFCWDYFFSRIFSLGFIENVILIIFFYRLFVCKRMVFVRYRRSICSQNWNWVL